MSVFTSRSARGDDRDDGAGRSGSRRAARAVQVRLVLGRRVDVDDEGDVVHVDPARRDVGGDEDTHGSAAKAARLRSRAF